MRLFSRPRHIIGVFEDGYLRAMQIDGTSYPNVDALVAVPRNAGWALAAGAAFMALVGDFSLAVRLAGGVPLSLAAVAAWWQARSLRRLLSRPVL